MSVERSYFNYDKLYHATFGCFKDEILKEGLQSKPENSVLNCTVSEYFDKYPIWLANDAEIAKDFVYASDAADELINSGVICFEVTDINTELLFVDPCNYRSNMEELEIEDLYDIENTNVESFCYLAPIPASQLKLIN